MHLRERAPMPRRGFLSTLAAMPILALPALPATAAVEPDAELIAFAAHFMRVTDRAEHAWLVASKRDDAVMLAEPKHPVYEPTWPGARPYRESSAEQLRKYLEDGEAEPMMTATDPWMVDMRTRVARMEAYETECERLKRHFRTEQADAVARRAEARLQDAAAELTNMRATTFAGIVAKTKALLATDALQSGANWAEDLALSILTEALAIGGAA